jgi:hypothetical protein
LNNNAFRGNGTHNFGHQVFKESPSIEIRISVVVPYVISFSYVILKQLLDFNGIVFAAVPVGAASISLNYRGCHRAKNAVF